MAYPQIVDYNEAVQNPGTAFTDPDLKAGAVAETPLGLPLALSGGFALTYTLTSRSGHKYAVRCFHRQVPEAEARYSSISKILGGLRSNYFVPFQFESKGIRVKGGAYPIVRMDWVEGDPLGVYLDRSAQNLRNVASLRPQFQALAQFLEQAGVAHGDIQNGNVMVSPSGIRLIDYDGMFVPGLPEGKGSETGHKHFQHPSRRAADFGPRMDRFSFIALDLSLLAISEDTKLHARFREGGETIVFKANDFADPGSSEAFNILRRSPATKKYAEDFAAVCRARIVDVPSLADFLAGKNIPQIAMAGTGAAGQQPKTSGRAPYIGAYDVLDAKDYVGVSRRVGDRIELVGQIEAIHEGTGRRGRGRGKPYVFINFGYWLDDIVRLSVWSEGLGLMTERPHAGWEGRWVSVVGLIDPPYAGKNRGRHYTHVGVTISSSSQINFITEQEARFRLGRSQNKSLSVDNTTIVQELKGGPRGRDSVAAPPPSPNARVVDQLRKSQGHLPQPTNKQSSSRHSGYSAPQQPVVQRSGSSGKFIWWVIALVILVPMLLRCMK